MWRQIGSLETAGTHQNANFAQKYFDKPVRGGENIFVCIKAASPTTPVLCFKTRPFQSGERCPTTDLAESIPLCISPILPYSTSLEESELRPNRKMLIVKPIWQSQIWYRLLQEMSIVRPLLLPRNISLMNPQEEAHAVIPSTPSRLAVWTISGKIT